MSDQAMREAIREALAAHGAWKLRLKTAVITGQGDVTSHHARCDDRCAFGRWLYGASLDEGQRQTKPYQVVRRLHADFHSSAADVLQAAEQGESARARDLLRDEFEPRSEVLKRALMKWLGEISQTGATPPQA